MFAKRNAETIVQEPPIITKPKPNLVVVGGNPIDNYEKAAEELGFIPAQLTQERILRFLAKEKIPTYDELAVSNYLISKTGDGKVWIWRPLREKDKPDDYVGWGASHTPGSYLLSDFKYRTYDKLVPLNILQTVKKMETEIPSRLNFFVSDYADVNPDPFIMIKCLDTDKIIFGVWDEPGFGT